MSRRIDICHAGDFAPGQRRIVNISDYDDVLVLNIGGECHAINNGCPHAGAALERGTVVGGVLFCPLHQWGFCLSTGESIRDDDLRAQTYCVFFEGDRLYLVLD